MSKLSLVGRNAGGPAGISGGVTTEPKEAFESLVVDRAPALLRLAVMLTGSAADAEDLLQATLLSAHRHAGAIVAMGAPAAYLRRIMVNEHLAAGRRRARRPRTTRLDDEVDVAAPPTRDPADHDEMWRLLAALAPQQRPVLALRYHEDLPDAEIAEMLGIREGTVRSTAFRALAHLRERLMATADRMDREPS